MPTFPFTFPYAGRTFSVVSDGRSPSEIPYDSTPASALRDRGPEGVYVRIIGIRGLHDFGWVEPDEPNDRLKERICRWYDNTYQVGDR